MLSKIIKNKIYGLQTILKFDNWVEIIICRILFPQRNLLVHKIAKMEIVVDYGAREQSGTCFCVARLAYSCLINKMLFPDPNITVVDAGANGGGFGPMLRRLNFSISKFLAIEMNPQTYSRMYLNVTRNIVADNKLILGALCGRNGETKVLLGNGSVADRLGGRGSCNEGREVEVKLLDFDSFIGQHYEDGEVIDLCKIDIEGAEFEMLFEGSCDRLKDCRYLIIELHKNDKYSEKDIFDFLDQKEFTLSEHRSPYEETVYMFVNRNLAAAN